MDSIFQLIQSYFHFRAAVLRTLQERPLSNADFSRYTGLCSNAKYSRLLRPTLWQPAEIHSLAHQTGLGAGGANKLAKLADLIAQLPPAQQASLLKAARLSSEGLQLRRQDPSSWQAQELEKLQAWHAKKQLGTFASANKPLRKSPGFRGNSSNS